MMSSHLVVTPIGAQARFRKLQRGGGGGGGGGDDVNQRTPVVAGWRCNLTGLSQLSNLYFIAYHEDIYVYQPHFPSQRLPDACALIVRSQPSAPALRGYIDPDRPHAINYLMVHPLGQEEVVATVRDDGDVDVFLVRHILHAIERRVGLGHSIGSVADEIRPVFQSNVGASAWGLAIHSEARTLAVSANTHNVTIFKFGLVSDTDDSMLSGDRATDVVQQVVNGLSNIPYIAFCNTGHDPEGQWLLTTDISGNSRCLNVVTMRHEHSFQFDHATRSQHFEQSSYYDSRGAGWTINFLDPRSFIREDTVQSALGFGAEHSMIRSDFVDGTWNIEETIKNVTQSHEFPVRSKPKQRSEHGSQSSVSEDTSLSVAEISESDTDNDNSEADYDLYGIGDGPDPENQSPEGGFQEYKSFASFKIRGDLPCPILYSSIERCNLTQPSSEMSASLAIGMPEICLVGALRQQLQPASKWLAYFERLNMYAHIPSIGVVVLASQKGRAMLLSLTKVTRTAKAPSEARNSIAHETTYAMRLEHILPLREQEERQERPAVPLAGISTGPIQGTEHLSDEKKRWRLFMMYSDNSVLSYEISRWRPNDSAVILENVMI